MLCFAMSARTAGTRSVGTSMTVWPGVSKAASSSARASSSDFGESSYDAVNQADLELVELLVKLDRPQDVVRGRGVILNQSRKSL